VEELDALPRTLTPIDATVVLAVANLLAFAWHCRVLAREVDAPRLTPADASAAAG